MLVPEDHPETEAAAKRLPGRARAHAGVLAKNPLPALVPNLATVLSQREAVPNCQTFLSSRLELLK
jgi:hypothetical protein